MKCSVHLLGRVPFSPAEPVTSRELPPTPSASAERTSVGELAMGAGSIDREAMLASGDEPSASEADATISVADTLLAMYYDAHVRACRPCIEEQATRGGAVGGDTVEVDSVASLHALMRAFARPPAGAACDLLEGEAYGPVAPRAHLRGYMRYLLRNITSAGGDSGTSRTKPSSPTVAPLRFIPCGGRSTLGFGLPSPFELYDCVAWPATDALGEEVGAQAVGTHSNLPAGTTSGEGVHPTSAAYEGSRARFHFLLLSAVSTAPRPPGEASRARDEAARLLERALNERWGGYRCFRVWQQLQKGRAPVVAELAHFVNALPVAVDLDEPFPSLRSLGQLRMQWGGLLGRLSQLPLRSCRWRDGDVDHLILLSASSTTDGDTRDKSRDQLMHCQLSPGGDQQQLRVRSCSTSRVTLKELITELSETVANAIACWVWSSSTAAEHEFVDP
jgi:hypothetical protein